MSGVATAIDVLNDYNANQTGNNSPGVLIPISIPGIESYTAKW